MKKGRRTALILAAALALIVIHAFLLWRTGPACLFVRSDEPFARTRCQILRHMKEESLPSVAAAVAREGTIIWAEAFGYSDLQSRTQATPDTHYRLGTGTSMLTTLAVEAMADKGMLDLDAPLLPVSVDADSDGLENARTHVTLRQLLSHRAGYPHYWHDKAFGKASDSPTPGETNRRYGFLAAPPGQHLMISSVGFSVLSEALVIITGERATDILRREGLEPLGLRHSNFLASSCDTEPLASEYAEDGQHLPCYATAVPVFDGGVASARDLVRIGVERLQEEALDSEIWSQWDAHGYTFLRMDGFSQGTKASLILLPGEDVAVAILANRAEADTESLGHWILAETLQDYRRSLRLATWQSTSDEASFKTSEPPASVVGDWEGELTCGLGNLEARLSVSHSRSTFSHSGEAQEAGTDRVFWSEDSLVVHGLDIQLPLPELEGKPHSTSLRLWQTDKGLSGLALALDESYRFGIPCQLILARDGG